MSDETTGAAVTTDQERNFKQLREKADALETQLAEKDTLIGELTGRVRSMTFSLAGLDPAKGIGKAAAIAYDGDLTVDAIREFAKAEFDWEPPVDAPAKVTPKVAAIAGTQQRVDALSGVSTPVAAMDTLDELSQTAEKALDVGDIDTAIAAALTGIGQRDDSR